MIPSEQVKLLAPAQAAYKEGIADAAADMCRPTAPLTTCQAGPGGSLVVITTISCHCRDCGAADVILLVPEGLWLHLKQ